MGRSETEIDGSSLIEHGLAIEAVDLGDQIVLIDTLRGQSLKLNATGADVWRLLGERRRFDDMTETLASKWSIRREECEEALQSFLQEMVRFGAVGGAMSITARSDRSPSVSSSDDEGGN